MKYNVKVGEKTYLVEIEDINTRPIVAKVDGERFEVFPENGITPQGGQVRPASDTTAIKVQAAIPSPSAGAVLNSTLGGKTLTAPLPGTVTEVFVKPGEVVEVGHVMLVIEAMKMKNSIRSIRGGTVAEVLVSAGQTVAHKQTLVTFEG
jgi:biotin carboxyl carrier protein